MKRIAAIIVLFCFQSPAAKAQALLSSECQKQFQKNPPVVMTFERIGKGKIESGNVIFRVHNLSQCDLVLYDESGNSLVWQKKPQGGLSFERTNLLLPDRIMPIRYSLRIKRNAANIYSSGSGGCLIYERILPAEQSTLLAIPLRIVRKYPRLWIQFEYSWLNLNQETGSPHEYFVGQIKLPHSTRK